MLTTAFQKREQAQYAEKISQLRLERDKASRELGQVNESLVNNRRELSLIEDKKISLNREIESIGHDILELKALHGRYKSHNEALVAEGSRIESDHKKKMENFEKEISRLKKSILDLETKENKFGDIDSYTREKQEELRVIFLRLQKARDDLKLIEDEAEACRIEMAESKTEVESLIKKNGIIMTENNKSFNILRIYVKRLQKYYNERGLKIDLIGQFKL